MSRYKEELLINTIKEWTDDTLILIRDLTKIYKSYEVEVHALNKLNLEIKKGEICAVMGPSGSGKTTLLKIIAGLIKPTVGSIYFKSEGSIIDLSLLTENNLTKYRRDNIGIVFQHPELFEELNVFENLSIPLLIFQEANMVNTNRGTPPQKQDNLESPQNTDEDPLNKGNDAQSESLQSSQSSQSSQSLQSLQSLLNKLSKITLPDYANSEKNEELINEILKFLGIIERKYHQVSRLSGGEKERVNIGCALIKNPKLILADEPTGELDTKNSKMVFGLLRDICKELGTTVFIVSHDPLVKNYVDRVIYLTDGSVENIEIIQEDKK